MAYRAQVYNSNIAGMFTAGGEVNAEAKKITRIIARYARLLAPARSGKLKASHRRRVIPSGIYGTRGYVENTAAHARYVHQGTYGPILPRRRTYLQLPAGYGWPALRASSVSGQRGQPWLLDAANRVLLRYGVRAVDGGDIERI